VTRWARPGPSSTLRTESGIEATATTYTTDQAADRRANDGL
jgi:hypothetical protein